MFYIGYTLYGYSKKEYENTYYKLPWGDKLNSVLEYIENFSNKHLGVKKLCVIIGKILCVISMFFERLWVKRNHLIDYGDKETYRILSPKIHDDIRNMYKDDLISYICLLEKYGKKELDTWGFEERPSKKIGVLKKIWYNLTLKVY